MPCVQNGSLRTGDIPQRTCTSIVSPKKFRPNVYFVYTEVLGDWANHSWPNVAEKDVRPKPLVVSTYMHTAHVHFHVACGLRQDNNPSHDRKDAYIYHGNHFKVGMLTFIWEATMGNTFAHCYSTSSERICCRVRIICVRCVSFARISSERRSRFYRWAVVLFSNCELSDETLHHRDSFRQHNLCILKKGNSNGWRKTHSFILRKNAHWKRTQETDVIGFCCWEECVPFSLGGSCHQSRPRHSLRILPPWELCFRDGGRTVQLSGSCLGLSGL